MDDTPYRLAYEASVRAIDDQTRVLEDLRSRAGVVFAAAALVTSFLGGVVLRRPSTGAAEVTAIGAFVTAALLTLAIIWPFRFRISLSARGMIDGIDGRAAVEPVTASEMLRELALQLETTYDRNARTIRPLLWCFRAAILLITLEVAAWVAALWRS